MSDRPKQCSVCERAAEEDEPCERDWEYTCNVLRGIYDTGHSRALSEIFTALTVTQSEGATVEQQLATARRQIERVLAVCGKGTGK